LSIVVSNTGPLIALCALDELELLPRLYGQIVIPDEVRLELTAAPPSSMRFPFAETSTWLMVKNLSTSVDPLLSVVLDVGEAAVIQMARNIQADVVLIDERKGRKVARTVYNLRVMGTMRVLVDAKKKGLLASVGSALTKIRQNGYWIHDDIVERALREAGE